MAKFVLLYKGPKGYGDTPDEQARLAAAWGGWYASLGGAVVDGGHPFGESSTLTGGGRRSGGVSELTGYVIISADDHDAACALAAKCPVLADAGRVEVYDAVEFG